MTKLILQIINMEIETAQVVPPVLVRKNRDGDQIFQTEKFPKFLCSKNRSERNHGVRMHKTKNLSMDI